MTRSSSANPSSLVDQEHPALIPFEACILAGGLSSRMGLEKARLRLGGRTLLAHIRASARQLGLPVRVIRRDAVERCGPLGGVYTALCTTKAEAVLFLACDMPFVSPRLLRRLLAALTRETVAVFAEGASLGFPFIVRRCALDQITPMFAAGPYSLQALAQRLGARPIRLPAKEEKTLFNVNTPAQYRAAQILWHRLNRQSIPRGKGSIQPRVARRRATLGKPSHIPSTLKRVAARLPR